MIVRPGSNGHAQAILEGGPEDQVVMVERFIAGRELTCAVIGSFVTDVIEIVPRGGGSPSTISRRSTRPAGPQHAAAGQDFTRC